MTPKIYTGLPQGSPHHSTLGLDHCEDPEVDKMHALRFGLGEFKTVLQGPILNFIETLLKLTFDSMNMFRSVTFVTIKKSSTYSEQSTPGFKALTIPLLSKNHIKRLLIIRSKVLQ